MYFAYSSYSIYSNSSDLAVITEHFGGSWLVVRDPRLLSCSPLSQYLITRPRQEKPPNLNSEQSIWFTTADILVFKYRQEQRHKMTQHILSQQKVTAYTLTPRPNINVLFGSVALCE